MQLIAGTSTNGTWEATWTVEDSYLSIYHVILEANNSNGINRVDITLR